MKNFSKLLLVTGIISLLAFGMTACSKSGAENYEALRAASDKTISMAQGELKIVKEMVPDKKSLAILEDTRTTEINLTFQRQSGMTLYKYDTANEYGDETSEFSFLKNQEGFYMQTEDGWIQSAELEINYADNLFASYLVDFTAENIEKITSKKKSGQRIYTVTFTDEFLNAMRGSDDKDQGIQELTCSYWVDKEGYITKVKSTQTDIMTIADQTDTITINTNCDIIRTKGDISFTTDTK